MNKNKKELASINTTKNLIAIARNHFSTYGYEKTSLEANMTRGAVYHHFKNKKNLFKAVLNLVQYEVGLNVEKEAMKSEDIWEQLILGCVGFVQSATLESNKRILLIEAPNIIEWTEWKKMDNENSVLLLEEQLLVAQKNGKLIEFDIHMISHMISGALNDLSIFLAESNILDKNQVYKAISHLLTGFRKDG
ncbi:TetR/AcrR family transcriptional regulator [Clostridioides sp. ES-S-0123-01]|uniref:TetR/AcrR family transcriptional regulator n=1 Tax=Clostridioides sp. ES-S-0123-01 TaxID=2770783 RepID=UPI001D11A9B1|nr:TetR/AcrR family transcriptional regulator [Clostridioides sp. ES-S-0123-01]